ncbi:MAG: chemotaxis protein CheB [Ktedonobacteraceae bacterium]
MASETASFPIVGIGASAGGLEAFRALLRYLPVNNGMAYVFVQHLDPTHESLLTPLIARATQMEVCEVSSRMVVEADHVYVIAPNTDLHLDQGVLTLLPATTTRGQHLSINTFLCSLAENRATQAIGVLLSGMGSDGTVGLKAIKEHGGATMAQDARSASFPMMPQSAIASGCVDFIGSSEEIAKELTRISHQPLLQQATGTHTEQAHAGSAEIAPEQGLPTEEQAFADILRLLHQKMGVDFTAYKLTTIKRRILRRMVVQHIESFAAYGTMLRDQQAEVEALYQDLLIGVTSFFRNPSTCSLLAREVFPRLAETKSLHDPIRVWVPGCSSGEEVYSLAICLLEFLAEHADTHPIQLFGTDLNPKAIEIARKGLYPAAAVAELSPARLERFFSAAGEQYQVNKAMRDLCIFAQHDLLHDPPFSRMDLLSCQNVLIYLQPAVQQKLIQIFHYALNPHGVLVLGPSETIRGASELFMQGGERKQPLYVKKATSTRPSFVGPVSKSSKETAHPSSEEENRMRYEERMREGVLQKEADYLLLDRYAPASLVIDAEMEICHFRGPISPYLEPTSGKASLNLFKMIREGLRLELRTALHQARKSGRTIKKTGIQMRDQNMLREVAVEVIPLKASATDSAFLILFEEVATPSTPHTAAASSEGQPAEKAKRDAKERRIRQLEQELGAKREEMRSIIEEMEATNEELQSANEEILSSNEELQSLNEELETSKEEIQASNEELLVVNQELHVRNGQLQTLRGYAEAIVETIREPLLVLDENLHVQSANRAFYQFFKTTAAATEQQILFTLGDGQWNIPALRNLLEEILPQNHRLLDYEVEHFFPIIGHKTILLNARRIDDDPLILLALEDVTERKRLNDEKQQLVDLVENSTDFIGYATLEGQPLYINAAGLHLVGLANLEEVKRTKISDYFPPQEETELRQTIQPTVLAQGQWQGESRYRHFQTGTVIPVDFMLSLMRDHETGQPSGFAIVTRDLTAQKQTEQFLAEQAEHLLFLAEAMPQKVWTATPDGNIDYMNGQWFIYTGLTLEDLKGRSWQQVIHPDDWETNQRLWQHSIDTGEDFQIEHRFRRADGAYRWHLSRGLAQRDSAGTIVRWVGTDTDVDEQRKLVEQREEFLGIASHELKTPVTSIKGYTQILQRRFAKAGDEQAATLLSKMDRQLNKLINLIGELLDLTKMEAGQLPWHNEVFDLNVLVQDSMEALRYTTTLHQISIEGAVHTLIFADRERINQVLTNLLSNAIKYSPQAETILVKLREEQNSVIVGVQDFGIGINPEKHAHLFERFFRVSDAEHESFPGLGLGLYISAQIVKRQGGRMWVDSTSGTGSTFFFTIPLILQESTAQGQKEGQDVENNPHR